VPGEVAPQIAPEARGAAQHAEHEELQVRDVRNSAA
jgi:hypothetical protein